MKRKHVDLQQAQSVQSSPRPSPTILRGMIPIYDTVKLNNLYHSVAFQIQTDTNSYHLDNKVRSTTRRDKTTQTQVQT